MVSRFMINIFLLMEISIFLFKNLFVKALLNLRTNIYEL